MISSEHSYYLQSRFYLLLCSTNRCLLFCHTFLSDISCFHGVGSVVQVAHHVRHPDGQNFPRSVYVATMKDLRSRWHTTTKRFSRRTHYLESPRWPLDVVDHLDCRFIVGVSREVQESRWK